MKITIIISEKEMEIKKAIALGWNERFKEELTHKDIKEVSAKDDILSAIPYLDSDNIEIEEIE